MLDLKSYLSLGKCQRPCFLVDDEIVYISVDSEGKSIFKKNLATGETKLLFNTPEIIWGLSVSGGKIFFTVDFGGNENEQIFVIDGNNEAVNITNAPHARHNLGGLLPDKKTYIAASNAREKKDFDIISINIETMESTIVLENHDNYNTPSALSPNGRYLLYNKLLGSSDNALWMLDLNTGETVQTPQCGKKAAYRFPEWLSDSSGFYLVSDDDADFDYIAFYDIAKGTFTKVLSYDWDVSDISLSKDDRYLAVVTNESGFSKLKVYDTVNKAYVNIPMPPKGVIGSRERIRFSPKGTRLAFGHTSGKRPADIWVLDIEADWLKKITDSLRGELTADDFVEASLHEYESFDGLTVPYLLYVPKGMQTNNLPVMISIHGGPEGQSTPGLMGNEFLQYMVKEGIAVVQPNVRGSTGYGRHYGSLDDVEKRLDSVKDIESLVKHLVEKGIADKDKIAVMSGSYGGFMTLSCAARYPDLFCCAVDTVGIFNLVTLLENTSIYRRPHRESEYGTLANHRDMLYNVSPIAMADNIKGPLMIIHGKNDPRVPVTEAYQATEYLKSRNVFVDLNVYDDEGHGLQKLKNKLECYPKIIEFVKRFMKL